MRALWVMSMKPPAPMIRPPSLLTLTLPSRSTWPVPDGEPWGELGPGQLDPAARRRRHVAWIERRPVGLALLSLRIGREHDQVDEAGGRRDLLGRDRAARHELLGLADDQAAVVVSRLGDGQGVERHRLLFLRAVAVLVHRGHADDADLDREGAIQQHLLVT